MPGQDDVAHQDFVHGRRRYAGPFDGGEHTLTVFVTDLCGAESNELTTTFTVAGAPVDDDDDDTPVDDDDDDTTAADDDDTAAADDDDDDDDNDDSGCGN